MREEAWKAARMKQTDCNKYSCSSSGPTNSVFSGRSVTFSIRHVVLKHEITFRPFLAVVRAKGSPAHTLFSPSQVKDETQTNGGYSEDLASTTLGSAQIRLR